MTPRASRTRSLIDEHTPRAVRRRLGAQPSRSYLDDFVLGAIDGAITTFAIVAGVAGAGLDATVVIILGGANLLADGLSMAASNYLGTRAARQQRELARQEEQRRLEAARLAEEESARKAEEERRLEAARQAEEARRQRRQAALEQKSEVQQQAQQILNEANGARQKVRAAMTSKYNVEF